MDNIIEIAGKAYHDYKNHGIKPIVPEDATSNDFAVFATMFREYKDLWVEIYLEECKRTVEISYQEYLATDKNINFLSLTTLLFTSYLRIYEERHSTEWHDAIVNLVDQTIRCWKTKFLDTPFLEMVKQKSHHISPELIEKILYQE